MSLFLRSLAFNILYYLATAAVFLTAVPTLLMSRHHTMAVAKAWARIIDWLLRVIVDIKVEFRGLERIPPGPLLIASKHQSAWETVGLFPALADPSYVLKRELLRIPFLGWYCQHLEMIPIDRTAGSDALRLMNTRARRAVTEGRQVIIFPEGTRRAVGAPPDYKPGVVLLYRALGVPCVPVALNSGQAWPRRTFLRRPGRIIVEFLDPLPPGLRREALLSQLQDAIETATARLEAENDGNSP